MIPAKEGGEVALRLDSWTVEGWRPWDWLLPEPFEAAAALMPDIGPVTATVPGSVRGALVKAGLVSDPYTGVGSRETEFTENRHWIWRTVVPAVEVLPEHDAILRFASLDGEGTVFINGVASQGFRNTHLPVEVDITQAIAAGEVSVAVAFSGAADDLGQIGWTSRRRSWKPRFNYGWDWTPRIVQIGIAGEVQVTVTSRTRIERCVVSTEFQPGPDEKGVGTVSILAEIAQPHPGMSLSVDLEGKTATVSVDMDGGWMQPTRLTLRSPNRRSWGADPAAQYDVDIRLVDIDGTVLDRRTVRVGFRALTWSRTTGAPEDAEPWLCSVDGRPLFLQGVNWVPIRPDYADVPSDEYRARLELYRSLGVNVIRVWGGAGLEKPVFYDLCDDLGLLVWQDLPLSSSGLDNHPPDDEEFASEVAEITRYFVESLSHHPSIAIWCGGNELSGTKNESNPPGAPLDFKHPALSAFRNAVRDSGSDTKIVPTSPSGPMFERRLHGSADGEYLHHDVHGPWAHSGTDAEWTRYWQTDDAMLRSEVGIAGASNRDLLEHFGLLDSDPEVQAKLWRHSASWWTTPADDGSDDAIAQSQARQARLLSIAASTSKARFPACAGFFVWMGHDAFPCPTSLAVVDFWGRPKPAAHALGEVFRAG